MFRILLITILIINYLSGSVGGSSVDGVSSFVYSVKQNGNGLVSYSTPDYSFKSVDGKNGKTYKKPILLNASQTAEPGEPDLPSSSTFLAIDPQKTYSVTVNIISSQLPFHLVSPSQVYIFCILRRHAFI